MRRALNQMGDDRLEEEMASPKAFHALMKQIEESVAKFRSDHGHWLINDGKEWNDTLEDLQNQSGGAAADLGLDKLEERTKEGLFEEQGYSTRLADDES